MFFECLSLAFYFLPFLHLFPFLMTDGDSMTINNLRDSANGTFDTLDDYLPLTVFGATKGICDCPPQGDVSSSQFLGENKKTCRTPQAEDLSKIWDVQAL